MCQIVQQISKPLINLNFPPLSNSRCRSDSGDREWCRVAYDGPRGAALSRARLDRRSGPVLASTVWPRRKHPPRTAVSGVPAPATTAILPGQHAGVQVKVSGRVRGRLKLIFSDFPTTFCDAVWVCVGGVGCVQR